MIFGSRWCFIRTTNLAILLHPNRDKLTNTVTIPNKCLYKTSAFGIEWNCVVAFMLHGKSHHIISDYLIIFVPSMVTLKDFICDWNSKFRWWRNNVTGQIRNFAIRRLFHLNRYSCKQTTPRNQLVENTNHNIVIRMQHRNRRRKLDGLRLRCRLESWIRRRKVLATVQSLLSGIPSQICAGLASICSDHRLNGPIFVPEKSCDVDQRHLPVIQ